MVCAHLPTAWKLWRMLWLMGIGYKEKVSAQKAADTPSVTHEQLRELAVKLSREGKREKVKSLIEKYGVKNITAVAVSDLDAFYADLQQMGGVSDASD